MTTTTTTTTTLAKRRGGDEEEEKDDDEEGTRTTFNRPRTTTTTEEEGDETRRIAFQLLSNSMYACDDDDDDDDQSEEERRRVFATTKPRRDAHKKEEATNRTKREEEEAKSMELARKLRRRLEAEGADEKRRRRRRRQKMAHSIDASSDDDDTNDDDDDDDTSTRYHRRRVQTHELVREASGEYQQMRMESTRGTTVSTVARDREHSNRSSTRPPLKGRQQKATTITGGFIRMAKPKTFETLKIVLDAVADRYDVNVGKTVWTNTLWKYVSREWDFSHSEQDDDDDDDVLKIIDVVNGRDAHQLIELWAKRRKMFRRSVVEAQSDDNNDENENENENENGQMNTIASELERIKSRAIRINPNAKGIVLLATARAYDDLGSTVAAKKAWTDVEEHYFHDDSKGMVELKIERLCSCARHVNRLDEAKKCFLDVALTMKPRTGLKRKAFTAACKVINQTKDVEFAKTVYDSLKRNRESGDAFIVATLISAFGFGVENNGRRPTQIEEMKKLGLQCWSRAKKKNVVLDGQCYSSIVGLMCKARDASKAMEIIRELENSEKWMARGTIGAKSFAAAFKYEQQKQCNDADDDESSTNDNDANRSKNRNDYDVAAAERLRQLKKQQFKELRDDREAKKNRENVEPAYAQVMHFLCDSKQPKQALIVFQNMQRNGVPPSKSTYRALYKALRYAGGRNGLRVSNKTAARYAIDVVTSNSQSTLKGGSPPFGTGGQKRRYRSSSSSLTVDRPTTSKDESKRHDLECILEICARAGLADEAIEVRDRLRFGFGDEIANAPEIRRCVVEAFQRSGPERVEEALAVYNEEMMCDENGRAKNANSQLSPEFWIFLSLALRDANLLSENVAILKECLLTTKKTTSNATTVQQKKYYPIAAANIIIDHCAKENVPGEAIDIFDLINRDDNPLIADSVTYLALLKSIKKMSKNGPATAERVMEEMISKRGEGFVTTEHLNSLLAAYARGGEKFLKKSEETFERIVRMRQSSKPDEFEFITMLYAYSVASKFRKATEFYDRFANTFASDGERKPRIFNAAIRATILEPRLFRDVETIEEVNVLREMYADMTRRTGVVGDPSVQKKREDKDDDGEECDKEVVGVNSSSSSSKNNAYLRKQSENALKMLTRVAAEVNAKVTISSSAAAPPSPSTSTSTTSTTRKPLHPASRNEGEDEDITTIDASSLTPTETRSAVLTLLLEFKKARQKHAIRVVNLSKENADAISRLAGDVRIDFHTIAIRKTSSSSSSKFEKDIAFDRDDVDAWLRKQHHQHQRER